MLFPVKVQYYKGMAKALKIAAAVIPMPKPTLFTGADSSLELCEAIAQIGIKKLLIVSDEVLVSLGLLNKITAKLDELSVSYAVYDAILPDPNSRQMLFAVFLFSYRGRLQ